MVASANRAAVTQLDKLEQNYPVVHKTPDEVILFIRLYKNYFSFFFSCGPLERIITKEAVWRTTWTNCITPRIIASTRYKFYIYFFQYKFWMFFRFRSTIRRNIIKTRLRTLWTMFSIFRILWSTDTSLCNTRPTVKCLIAVIFSFLAIPKSIYFFFVSDATQSYLDRVSCISGKAYHGVKFRAGEKYDVTKEYVLQTLGDLHMAIFLVSASFLR